MSKNDLINDLRRQILVHENDIRKLDGEIQQEKAEN